MSRMNDKQTATVAFWKFLHRGPPIRCLSWIWGSAWNVLGSQKHQ